MTRSGLWHGLLCHDPRDLAISLLTLRAHWRREGIPIAQINPEALDILEAHAWPGNVRELENVLKGAMVLARGDELASEHVLALLELPEGEGDRGGDSWLHAVASLQFHPARAEFETLFIRRALRAAGGNLSQAAQMMELARRTLQRKVQEYEIDVEEFKAR